MENENRNPESFHVLARIETDYWDSEVLALHKIRAAFGLYLFRPIEATHLCSLTPAHWCEFLQNEFIFDPDATESEMEAARDALTYEGATDPGGMYLEGLNPDKLDSRFLSDPIEIDPADAAPDLDPDSEDYRRAIWDEARESWNANPDQPGIIWDSAFDEWEAEQAAARRAENRPPCDYRRGDVLPLFGAAWKAAQETIGKVEGWGADQDGARREAAFLAGQGWGYPAPA